MDVVTLQAAKAYAASRVPMTGLVPAPPCAGRPWRAGMFSSLTNVTFRRVYRLMNDASQVRLVYTNLAMYGAPNENAAGPITIHAQLTWDYGASQTVNLVTFSGSTTVTLAPYQTVISDPIDVSFNQTAGTYFPIDTYVSQTGGLSYMPGANYEGLVQFGGINEGYLSGDFAAGTTNSFGGATKGHESYGPMNIIGWSTSGKSNATFCTGDSIMSGTGWTPVEGSLNFAHWALDAALIPSINLAEGGETLQTAATYSTIKRRMALVSNSCKYAICEYGVNDLPSRTVAQMKADYITYWTQLKRRGMKVFQTTITPDTNSTDGWQTISGQSYKTVEATRQAINKWLRAPASAGAGNSARYDANGILAGVFDTAAQYEVDTTNAPIVINPADGSITNATATGYTLVDPTTYGSGTVTAATSTTMTDSTKSWTTNQWIGYTVAIVTDTTTPSAVGKTGVIVGNTSTQLTLDGAGFVVTPSTVATYRLIKTYTTDGTHPTTLGHKRMANAIDTSKLPVI